MPSGIGRIRQSFSIIRRKVSSINLLHVVFRGSQVFLRCMSNTYNNDTHTIQGDCDERMRFYFCSLLNLLFKNFDTSMFVQ